jgi:hypothetical protein
MTCIDGHFNLTPDQAKSGEGILDSAERNP